VYTYEITPHLQGILRKLSKKNKSLYEQVLVKINEIMTTEDIEHYKNLKHDMKDRKRVHIGHFVLVFKILSDKKQVDIYTYEHHDDIYFGKWIE